MKAFQSQTLYEVLEVSVGAGEQEIRGAYARLTRLYGEDQVALYGLIESSQAAELHARLREALEVLIDDGRRDAYDRSIGLPPRAGPGEPRTGSVPPPVAPTSSTGGWSQGYAWVTPEPEAPALGESPAAASGVVPGAAPARPSVSSGWEAPAATASWVPRPAMPSAPGGAAPARPLASPPPTEAGPAGSGTSAWLPYPGGVEPGAAPIDVEGGLPPDALPDRSLGAAGAGQTATAGPAQAEPAPVPSIARAAVAPTPAAGVPRPPLAAPAALTASPPTRGISPLAAQVPLLTPASAAPTAPVNESAPGREVRPESRLRPFELPAGVEFNGDLLRQVRLARGVSLHQIAERTRIGARHLENLEADRYDALPATVYLRGILMSLARELGLDGVRVARSYLQFVEAHRLKG